MTATLSTPTPIPLTATDRCDRCGAQAYVRVTLASGSDLLFCAHHARAYASGLKDIAVDVHDETDRLVSTPATAALDER